MGLIGSKHQGDLLYRSRYLTLGTLRKKFTRRQIDIIFSFSQETGFDIQCILYEMSIPVIQEK